MKGRGSQVREGLFCSHDLVAAIFSFAGDRALYIFFPPEVNYLQVPTSSISLVAVQAPAVTVLLPTAARG